MKQNTLKFHIRQQVIHRDDDINLVIGNTPAIVTALFRFTSEWNVLEKKVAWFTRKSDGYITSVELQQYSNSLTTYTCDIPTSMLYNQGFSIYIEGIDETDDSNNLVTSAEYVQVRTSATPQSELKLFRHYGQIRDIDDNCIGYISFLSTQQAAYTSDALAKFIIKMGFTAERSGFGYMQSDEKAYYGMSLLYVKDGVLTTVNCYKVGYDGPCNYVALKVVGVSGTTDDLVTDVNGESGEYVAGVGIDITGLTISVKNYNHLTTDEQLAAKLEGYVSKEQLATVVDQMNDYINENDENIEKINDKIASNTSGIETLGNKLNAAETTLTEAITKETERATDAEAELLKKIDDVKTNLEDEATRAKAAENQLVDDIQTSVEQVDEALQQVMTTIDSKQDKLTAGTGITITDNTIAVDDDHIKEVINEAVNSILEEEF